MQPYSMSAIMNSYTVHMVSDEDGRAPVTLHRTSVVVHNQRGSGEPVSNFGRILYIP